MEDCINILCYRQILFECTGAASSHSVAGTGQQIGMVAVLVQETGNHGIAGPHRIDHCTLWCRNMLEDTVLAQKISAVFAIGEQNIGSALLL